MIINSISIRNFKSYGNNLQKLSFGKDAELILIVGENGGGKSSLLESIDFTLYSIVRGKNSKRVPNYILPNRTNKNLETEIDFINWNNDKVVINRKLNPKGFDLFINDINRTDEYNLMSQDDKDEIIGIEYNTYKSLVSLNLADFANFINLDTDTKKKLLNKIFNIEEIDDYFSITKELLKNTYRKKEKIETHISLNNNTINTYKNNIQNILQLSGNINKDDIKDKMLSYKDKYKELEDDIKELSVLQHNIKKEIDSKKEVYVAKKNKIYQDEIELNELGKKIDIFKQGNCPFCGSILTDDIHKVELEQLNINYEDFSKRVLELKKSFNILKNDLNDKLNDRKNVSNERESKKLEFELIKNELINLKKTYYQNIESLSIDEINKNILNTQNDNLKYEKVLDKINIKIEKYQKLVDILSEKGIRKGIINNVVDPINEHLNKYLIELESKYNVKLNDEFDAIIKERFTEDIHVESLSTGEARKINIAIALSYMEMVLNMNRKTNILFMDEVFASVDPDNIDLMLKVLRTFSKKNNINVIIVNHSTFDTAKFDRVIEIEKILGYSQIKV